MASIGMQNDGPAASDEAASAGICVYAKAADIAALEAECAALRRQAAVEQDKSERLGGLCDVVGAILRCNVGETLDDVARRVVSDRDLAARTRDAVREIVGAKDDEATFDAVRAVVYERAALQAANARLVEEHRAEKVERLAAEERAMSFQVRVDELNIAGDAWRNSAAEAKRLAYEAEAKRDAARSARAEAEVMLAVLRDVISNVRTAIGANPCDFVVEEVKRVVAERDIATARADAAERLAHEAEAQREAAVRELDDARAKLARIAEAQRQIGDNAAPLNIGTIDMGRARLDVPVQRVCWSGPPHDLPLPAYAKPGDAGMDLRARVDPKEPLWIKSGERAVIPCGFAFAIPEGYEGQVRPRSGLSRDGIVCSLGTIDSGYRGEVAVVLTNTRAEAYPVREGDRIAQLVVNPIARATLREVDALDETERGASGFGSSGRA